MRTSESAAVARLRAAGHEVSSVHDQGLDSAEDAEVLKAAHLEQRALVTLDMDFGNPLLFRASDYSGIAILRLPRRPSAADLIAAADMLIAALKHRSLAGKLCIVQRNRVREYQPDN